MPPVLSHRVTLFSHDTQGLGHIRRNIELAGAMVAADPSTEVLLIGSAHGAERLPLPPSTRLELVPRVVKHGDGSYAAADDGRSLSQVLAARSARVAQLLRATVPDLLVVDKLARGLHGELDVPLATLRGLRTSRGRRPRVVLGLRDVLDEAEVAAREWEATRTTRTVLEHYDEVWVYGDPDVYDPVREYGLPAAVAERVRYTGYLAAGRLGDTPTPADDPARTPYVLCLVGGGQDGISLARAFASARYPTGHRGVIVTGPQMRGEHSAELSRLASTRHDLEVHPFLPDPTSRIRQAAAVVTMGGYNTVCEVLATRRPALVVPRERPRLEQAVRADRLAAVTHLDVLRPGGASATALAAWLTGAVGREVPPHPVRLDGLAVVPDLADALLAGPTGAVAHA
jgi:predicted glycosyltransferase